MIKRRTHLNHNILFVFILLILSGLYRSTATASSSVSAFSTNGYSVYHLKPGTVNNERVIFSAAYDGTVLCHKPSGELLWKTSTGEGFLFDLAVGDINNDGHDEALAASSDGTLYAIGHNGTSLWKFQREAPLWQVAITKNEGKITILTGGVECVLFALNQNGKEVASTKLSGAIRLISCGKLRGDGKQYAGVVTTNHGLRGECSLYLYQLPGLLGLWSKEMKGSAGTRGRYFSVQVFDFNNDGKDEMVFGMENYYPNLLVVYNGDGERKDVIGGKSYAAFNWQAIHPGYEWQKGEGIPQLPYEMNLLAFASDSKTKKEKIYCLYGKHLIVRDREGKIESDLVGRSVPANIAFDKETGNLYLGSDVSGGDEIIVIRTRKEGWEKEFENQVSVGKMAQLEKNLDLLLHQAENFEPPSYQAKNGKSIITLQQNPEEIKTRYTDKYDFGDVDFVTTYKYIERYDHGMTNPLWVKIWHQHHSEKISTREQILNDAKRREEKGENFLILGGHAHVYGIDFYVSAETLTELLKVAPTTFKGTAFLELESTDETMAKAVQEQLLPLAKEFYKQGNRKILLRNKNIFWNGPVHLDFWKEAFTQTEYREVFVPSMEETNSRTQGLSLAGRTGLLLTGKVNHMSGRAVTDNVNWNRSWEYGQTGHLSHMLRALALSKVYGADWLHINIYSDNKTELLPLFLLVNKGALPCPKPEDILSVSDVTVGVTTTDAEFMHHGTNGHQMTEYQLGDDTYVFDMLDCYWGGAPTPVHDFTRMAYGSKRRLTNFIPRFPYGMVTTVSAETDISEFPRLNTLLKTDGKHWINDQGEKQSAGSQILAIQDTLEKAAEKLPVRVFGDVSWSVLRIDAHHVRVILIDPGYLDPADRKAEIKLQHLEGVKCIDILTKEELAIANNFISVKVPLGILRIVDIEHQ